MEVATLASLGAEISLGRTDCRGFHGVAQASSFPPITNSGGEEGGKSFFFLFLPKLVINIILLFHVRPLYLCWSFFPLTALVVTLVKHFNIGTHNWSTPVSHRQRIQQSCSPPPLTPLTPPTPPPPPLPVGRSYSPSLRRFSMSQASPPKPWERSCVIGTRTC